MTLSEKVYKNAYRLHFILFDYDSDQFYRFSELLETSETGLYIAGIKKTKKSKGN